MSTVRIPSRQRRWPVYVIAAIVILAIVFTVMSQFYVDLLWFREVGFTSVFWTDDLDEGAARRGVRRRSSSRRST